ncbi:hypothetical protein CPJCM30710_27910 [Clostridium polyendosporum]|uniref:Uncharacterized protein n=1 Tax=Clostridium polyendosporum TaxID=69208 RepID=A0A919S0R8_9CLOT|nr:hypothetical protein [Clostridium polyendosporum]GIM30125.1 hypothetical protein CPJCM30710_27910 [Clostridium polyendosporum]
MADVKTTTMRLSEETIKTFKEIASKEGFTQEQCLAALINNFELQNTKIILGDRKKEIETFEDYANKLVSLYLNSLEMNKNAEQRIREELKKQLVVKEDIINELQKQKQDLVNRIAILSTANNKSDEKIKGLEKSIFNLEELNKQNKILLEKAQEEKESVITQSEHFEQLTEAYSVLEKEKERLLEYLNASENNIIQLELRVSNEKERIDYLNGVIEECRESLKDVKKEHKNELELLKIEHKNDIKSIKATHKEEIQNLFSEVEERTKEKFSLELEKLRIEKEREIYELIKRYDEEIKNLKQKS